MMSWKPEVKVHGDDKWYGNTLRFATMEEAENNAHDRWALAKGCRATPSEDPVNYTYVGGVLKAVESCA